MTCEVCSAPRHQQAQLCRRCKTIYDRVEIRKGIKRNPASRLRALKAGWDGTRFRCFYTNVPLVEDDHHNPLYLTFDHKKPRCEDEMVIAAAVINDMKTDMSDEEFRRVVLELAKTFGKGIAFDETVLRLQHWKR